MFTFSVQLGSLLTEMEVIIFVDFPVEKILASNPPIYFERNMRSMIALAKEHQIDVIVATFAHSPFFEYYSRSASPQFQDALAEHNDILRVIAGADVYLYDFAEEMPTDKKYYIDGIHFSGEGNQLRASMFADFIIKTSLIPSP